MDLYDHALEKKEPWAMEALHPFYISVGRYFQNFGSGQQETPFFTGNRGVPLVDSILPSQIYGTSSAPISPGFSGGGVFRENGNLVGINAIKIGNQLQYDGMDYGTSIVKMKYITITS